MMTRKAATGRRPVNHTFLPGGIALAEAWRVSWKGVDTGKGPGNPARATRRMREVRPQRHASADGRRH
jgi:hypothetical protein